MNLTDTHAHLYWDSFKEDFDQVIACALDAGVKTIINVGVDIEKSQEALDQTQSTKWPQGLQVFSTIGIHPHEAQQLAQGKLSEELEKLEQIYKSNPKKVVAVGECGLDYLDTDEKIKQLQRQLFQAQIDLAKRINLPLIVHCRQAWDEVIKMTRDHFGIYHCYSGLSQTTNSLLQTTNFFVSFAGNLTYPKNEYLREAAKIIPLNRIVLETDCPFLPPQSKRGKRNEPANIVEIARLIANLKDISLEEVASQTSANAVGIFAL